MTLAHSILNGRPMQTTKLNKLGAVGSDSLCLTAG
jgi:hypothetical protein